VKENIAENHRGGSAAFLTSKETPSFFFCSLACVAIKRRKNRGERERKGSRRAFRNTNIGAAEAQKKRRPLTGVEISRIISP
jgi:hypothetical protein